MARKINFFSSKNRRKLIDEISSNYFDIVVIGGGITGAGICLDAVSRGLNVCLIEMNDFASGTSSKSTKLIHGGLRYLEQLKLKLVNETGREREVLHRIAPHLVKSEKMLLPIFINGKLNKFFTYLALFLYDYLAGVKNNDKKKMLSKKKTLIMEPLLNEKKIKGGALYSEYRTDDSRLTIEILMKAYNLGALPINYIKAKSFIYDNGRIAGVNCNDQIENKNLIIKSKTVINASGSWTDDIIKGKNKKLILSKGIHIVLPIEKFPINQSVYFDALDGRMIFSIPREKTVYIGTTDTVFDKEKDKLCVLKKEVKYLIDSVNNAFSVELELNDVISSWVGLRPLIRQNRKNVSEISRKDEIFIAKNGMITIAGGKLTGYRKMAERVVNILVKKFKFSSPNSKTKNLKLFDFNYNECLNKVKDLGISSEDFEMLYNVYGEKSIRIFKIYNKIKNRYKNHSLLIAEITYCIKNEMCHNLLDFFSQRNAMIYFDIDRLNKSLEMIKEPYMEIMNISYNHWKKELKNIKKYIFEITNFI